MASRHQPTDDQLREARTHLYVALVESLPSDEPLILGHVREALLLLGGELPGRYRCCSPNCPGYPYRASELPHPADTCVPREAS